jgi:hypothetical protein
MASLHLAKHPDRSPARSNFVAGMGFSQQKTFIDAASIGWQAVAQPPGRMPAWSDFNAGDRTFDPDRERRTKPLAGSVTKRVAQAGPANVAHVGKPVDAAR